MIISTIGLTLFCGLMAYADQSKQSFAIAVRVHPLLVLLVMSFT